MEILVGDVRLYLTRYLKLPEFMNFMCISKLFYRDLKKILSSRLEQTCWTLIRTNLGAYICLDVSEFLIPDYYICGTFITLKRGQGGNILHKIIKYRNHCQTLCIQVSGFLIYPVDVVREGGIPTKIYWEQKALTPTRNHPKKWDNAPVLPTGDYGCYIFEPDYSYPIDCF